MDHRDTSRAFNPTACAGGLRGTALYLSCGSGAAPVVGGTELLPEVLESILRPAPHVFAAALELRGIAVTTHYCEAAGTMDVLATGVRHGMAAARPCARAARARCRRAPMRRRADERVRR
ncbi:hypothetical protein ABZ461_39470 [Actinacidiphila glaucinigra]|uniref:hypothetical protein n=1 Tax=Actinacidiphila glaucinigra TaxID=235986 RepID=UPI0033DF57DD